jgi:hypothetical protein
MKTRFLIIVLVFVSIPILPEAHACSCAAPVDYVQAISESEYGFTGTVTYIDNSDGPQKVHFDISSVVKGDILENQFVLENNNLVRHGESVSKSSCDVGYKVGVTYNVFVYDNVHMNNGMCDTKPVGFLGVLNPTEYNLSYYLALGLIVSTVTGIVVWRKRK